MYKSDESRTTWKCYIMALLPLFALCILFSTTAKADYPMSGKAGFFENIVVVRPGETYDLRTWYNQFESDEVEIVSSNKKVVKFVKNWCDYNATYARIKGVKSGTATLKMRQKHNHSTVYSKCKIIIANYTRYYGTCVGDKKTSYIKNFPVITKASIIGNKLTLSGKLMRSKKSSKKAVTLKNKTFKLTSKTIYGGFEIGDLTKWSKAKMKRFLEHPSWLQVSIWVSNGKVLMVAVSS